MDAASVYIARKLVERIEEKREEMTRPLILGQAADFADYKDRAGYLRGLADALRWLEEIRFDDEERPR